MSQWIELDGSVSKGLPHLVCPRFPLLLQVFDGWELNGNVFPSSEDHGLSLKEVRQVWPPWPAGRTAHVGGGQGLLLESRN